MYNKKLTDNIGLSNVDKVGFGLGYDRIKCGGRHASVFFSKLNVAS